jgi:hypothetical protein
MKDHIIAIKDGPHRYHFAFNNGAKLGVAEASDDGYFYFWPENAQRGYWAPYLLRAIADKLDEINKPWNDVVERDLEAMRQLGFWDVDPTTSKFDDDERE